MREAILIAHGGDRHHLCPNPSVSLRPAAVAPQHLAVFLVRVAIGEPLASRTSIDILVSDVDEVLLAKRPSDFAPDVIGFGSVTVMPASWHARICGLLK